MSNTDIIAAMSNLTAEDKLVRVFRSLDKGQSGTIEFTDFMDQGVQLSKLVAVHILNFRWFCVTSIYI